MELLWTQTAPQKRKIQDEIIEDPKIQKIEEKHCSGKRIFIRRLI